METDFNLQSIMNSIIAAILYVALNKIRTLSKALKKSESDPPPACIECKLYREHMKEELKQWEQQEHKT
jgi:hypothetical protein